MLILYDENSKLKGKIDPVTGFLTAQVRLARTGVQQYRGYEIGVENRANELIGVFRPPYEVFDKESIASFVNLVVTDDHPENSVTTDNVKEVQKGQVSDVRPDNTGLIGLITVTDKEVIKKVMMGKREVSVGYFNVLKPEKGVYNGDKYEYIQTDIRANHLSIVDAGRCGAACRLQLDKKEERNMFKITIDGIDYQTEDAQLKQAIENLKIKHSDEVKEIKKKLTEEEEEKLKAEKEKEKAMAEKDAIQKKQMTDADISALVAVRAELLSDAKIILGDKMPECTDCPKDVKLAVIDHVMGKETSMKDKSEDYINAMYDIAIQNSKKAKKNQDNLSNDFSKKPMQDKDFTRDSAYEKYKKDLGLV